MADTVENSIEAVVGTAAPAEGKAEGIDQAITPASARDTAARAHAGPATKSVPVKKNAGRTNQVGPQRDVAAKAATPRKPMRKARAVAPAASARPASAPQAQQPKPRAAAPAGRTATAPSKEPRIMTTPATEVTEKFQAAIKDASAKAKAAFEKSQASFGEMGAFTKGNVEALVESSKIFAAGLQALSKGYMTESKSAFETLTAEMKEMAAVKSPTELMEKQTALLRKQFDAAVAVSSKNSEAVLKLANEAFQPISTRVSLAVEKIKHAA